MIVLGLLGIVFLVFLVAVLYSSRNLIWPHVLLWIGLFLLGLSFLFAIAWTWRAKSHWLSRFDQTQRELDQVQQRLATIQSDLRNIRHTTRVELTGRGRVWRNLVVAGANPGGLVIDARRWNLNPCVASEPSLEPEPMVPPSDAAAPAQDGAAAPAAGGPQPAAAAPAHGLQPGMVVWAFREAPLAQLPAPVQEALFAQAGQDELGAGAADEAFYQQQERLPYCRVPVVYVGQFQVMNVAGPMVTLASNDGVEPQQLMQTNPPGQVSWALYERLPDDRHDAYQGLSLTQLQALLPAQMLGLQGPAYEALVQSLAADGQEMAEAGNPETTWVRVEFLRTYEVAVDAPEAAAGGEETFDAQGQALASALRQGQPTTFEQGDTAELDWATAQRLRDEGHVRWVGFVHRRDLRNYGGMFSELARRQASLRDQLAVAQGDLEKLQKALELLNQQQAATQEQLAALRHDQQGLRSVQQQLNTYGTSLESRWNNVRQRMADLYRENLELHGRLGG